MIKKIIFCLIFILAFLGNLDLVNAAINFGVKRATDTSYSTQLSNVSNGEEISFRIVKNDGSTSNKNFVVNMPSGFEYQNYTTVGCTNFSLKSSSNASFSYSYSGSSVCSVIFKYKPISATSGNKEISLIYNGSSTPPVDIGIVSTNSISRAITRDTNNNGYIDAYEITFANPIGNTTSFSGLTIGGLSPTSYVGNTNSGLLYFPDNNFNSGELPQIISQGNIFVNVGQISNNSISEEDGASPTLLKVNNQNISGNSISIGTGSIIFDFSEKLNPGSYQGFTLSGAVGTFSVSDERLTFNPTYELSPGTYRLLADSLARDYSNNQNAINNINISLVINDVTPPYGLSLGSGTGIIINNGASYTNNNYVQLSILANDNVGVDKMFISNNSDFSTGNWENYSTSKLNWYLGNTSGTKTIYIKFKDASGNISQTYSGTIEYVQVDNYIIFNPISSTYTDDLTIALSGSCNYISNTGSIITNIINYSVNNSGNSTFTCNTYSKTWSNIFSLNENSQNIIRVWYGSDYNSSTIKNSITITNPLTACSTGYTRVGNSCVPNSCNAITQIINGKTYNIPALSHGSSGFINSSSTSITGGSITYKQNFSCNLGNITTVGNEIANTPTCNAGYTINGSSCTPSDCTAQIKIVDGKTYNVPALSHSTNAFIDSNSVNITGGSITYKQNFSCSFGVVNTVGSSQTNSPTCNSGYAANGIICSTLDELSCKDPITYGGIVYNPGIIAHLGTGTRTSNAIDISNGKISYNQSFSCNAGILTPVGDRTSNTPTCNAGYTIDGTSCVPSNCSGTGISISGRYYQVPNLAHNTNANVTSTSITINGGKITYSQSFKCELGTISSVNNEIPNTPTCNAGYKVDGYNCTKISSGGGGGGGGGGGVITTPSTCSISQLVCENGKYYRKSGESCSGGELGKTCSITNMPTDNSNSNNNNSNNNENTNQIGEKFEQYLDKNGISDNNLTIKIVGNYLNDTTNKGLKKVINSYYEKIVSTNLEKFSLINNDFKDKYNKLIISYKDTFENINEYLISKDKEKLLQALNNYKNLSQSLNEAQNIESTFISKKTDKNNTIFKTNVTSISKVMDKVEIVMFNKYNKLLYTKKISQERYKEIIEDYNNFILYISVYKINNDDISKNLAKNYLEKVIKNYKIK